MEIVQPPELVLAAALVFEELAVAFGGAGWRQNE